MPAASFLPAPDIFNKISVMLSLPRLSCTTEITISWSRSLRVEHVVLAHATSNLEIGEENVPDELPLPSMFDARTKLLQAMCLLYEGIEPHSFKVLQVVQGTEFWPATMQPVVFSLAEGLEMECSEDNGITARNKYRLG
ncbi:hypothetical protein GN244_ATG13308 [Phytophthora infestans]|uniref:Uncharacterized protein n=1 Tax=Phytophthora infestans TaxID=4787 RepID=A0A833SXS1_PHYIN|nr:hypothetical protein GN244_ATG13308 [Phytophthora infestans]